MTNKQMTQIKLSSIIRDVINETIKSDLYANATDEKEMQDSITEEDDELFDEPSVKKSSKTLDSEREKLEKGNVSAEDVIEKLNAIRAGRSFRDESISAKLEEYVESLTKAEKVALLAYLKGLSQIVSGEVEVSNVIDPGDDPATISMKKKNQVQKKTIKPNIIKKPMKDEEEKKKPSAEDTSGPVPIKPKK